MTCDWCGEPVLEGERADTHPAVLHTECLVRALLGSAAHQLGDCSCCGGTRSDPPGASKRESARLALAAFRAVRSAAP